MSDEHDKRRRGYLARLRVQYQERHNPLFVWHAYRWCRTWK